MVDPDWERLRNWTTLHFRRAGAGVPLDQLLAGAREGSLGCLGELYQRYRKLVFDFLVIHAPNDADDLTQETFIKLPDKLVGYQDRGSFDAWLRGVAFNLYRTRQRSNNRRSEDPLPDDDRLGETSAMGSVTRNDLWKAALDQMPAALKDAWLLHRQGYEAAEIGERLGISAGAAATRLSRARDFISRRLPDLT